MITRILAFILVVASVQAQTAVYPSSVVTDAQLKVAINSSQTSLSVSINSTQTSFTVASCSPVVSNQLVTIDNEVMSVTSCSGNSMVVGARPFPDVGNTNTSHASGALVNGWIDAWHHNSLTAEVKAIETALGSNLSNVLAATSLPLSSANGGTGVNNGTSTITLNSGSLTFNGGHNVAFTMPSAGTWTFPAVGTLISTGDTGTVTNTMLAGSINQSKLLGSIPASKLVQTDITAVGTIATGVWNGTAVGPVYGGTGANNGTNSLTITGNPITFASPSNSTWTLPAAGTLVGSADTGSVTNTMLAGSIAPSKITGTAAILGANTFTGNQTMGIGTIYSGAALSSYGSCVGSPSTNWGKIVAVNDSNTVTWGATITGGSSSFVLAFCDATNWTVIGK